MSRRQTSIFLTVACVLVVMLLAVLVRVPSAFLVGTSPEVREAYTTSEGIPYLTEADSYYHVRITENYLDHGMLGDAVLEDGTPWDTKSFFPEGRSADYQPGIVWLTHAAWAASSGLIGCSLYQVEYCLSAALAMLVAIAAFVVGMRMSGRVGAVVAGVLVACSSSFVFRTTLGRFDTDMFVVLLDVMLILLITECLRAKKWRVRLAFCCAFALAVYVYTLCWTPKHAMLLGCVALLGGFLFALLSPFVQGEPLSARLYVSKLLKGCELRALLVCSALLAVILLASRGPGFYGDVLEAALKSSDVTASSSIPNLFASISELGVAGIVPGALSQWFLAYVPGGQITVINGVGGLVPAVLAGAALIRLAFRSAKGSESSEDLLLGLTGSNNLGKSAHESALQGKGAFMLDRRECLLYACVLGVFLIAGIYGVGRGARFIEHLAVPVGILAGAFAGWFLADVGREPWGTLGMRIVCATITCAALMLPTLIGSAQLAAGTRPSVSDSAAEAMAWIKSKSEDPRAVIASWWDDGYFYESESGHPCLWDGGSMDGKRAILVCNALLSEDFDDSRMLLLMLCGSGNQAIDVLLQHADPKTAFDALLEAVPLGKSEAAAILADRCGLSQAEAERVESLVHPESAPEVYLVLTSQMMRRFGWFEYYAQWDFEKPADVPASTLHDTTPDGRSLFDADDEEAVSYYSQRSQETLWRLFLDGEQTDCFTPVFEMDDGVERVCVWRVNLVEGTGD